MYIGAFDYQAQVITDIPSKPGWVNECGGTVIGKHWILTAAHCAYRRSASDITVRTGSRIKNEGVKSMVTTIFVHDCYQTDSRHNYDLALLYVEEGLPACQEIGCVGVIPWATYNDDSFYDIDTELVATGWGYLSSGGSSPTVLQKVKVPVVDCFSYYRNDEINKQDMFCAGVVPGKDTCQGDSGGPLVKFQGAGNTDPLLVGVTSWGRGCGTTHPGVYANVAANSYWIEQVMLNKAQPSDTRFECRCCTRRFKTCTPKTCIGYTNVLNWVDSQGDSCNWYYEHDCPDWATYNNTYIGTDGKIASEACCTCGGGYAISQGVTLATKSPSGETLSPTTPAPTDSPSATPYPTSSALIGTRPPSPAPTSAASSAVAPSALLLMGSVLMFASTLLA